MTLKDKQNNSDDLNNLLSKFIEGSQRKRKNLIKEIELSVDGIYVIADSLFNKFDREGDDWAGGWILQVLKKYKPEFFNNNDYNKWFSTSSDQGIDYDQMQLKLLEQNFEEADRLTSSYLRKLAGKVAEKRGYVFYSEVKNISGLDLVTIDRLWNIYSQGKFGFSIQAKLLKTVGKRYELLWPKIGWKNNGIWTRYPSSFTWTLDAPDGHMPLVNQLRGVRLMDSLLRHPSIAERHDNCL
ncbi:MAG: hypothetical protein CMK49_03035 [Prochlorococcus sp. SP3034]|nr:hypothetical protein [Prochlorococcus sp. SP3034]|tara:strand:- start:878 stop:1597 length:720 start_codon:yes stop_codon:yes gene_type:complete